jgi:hypothetical protein
MAHPERRDPVRRALFVQAVVTDIVQSRSVQFTVETVQSTLHVNPDIALRMLQRLASAGLLKEVRPGVWFRVVPSPDVRRSPL